ncbi:HU family DNA-binding protein [Actinoallomurus sp. CA-142502]|uniref:HU family DNA-binding protein n=1 Tax=Actinoallomurus sp. CA-142502 TaxID=3239885 RepID=UPI003D8AA6EA
MNKRELVEAIADRLPSKAVAGDAVEAILDTIQETVAQGEKVTLTGFGTFERANRPARAGRNPATGDTIQIPARSVPTFKAGAVFKGCVDARRFSS